MDLQRFFLKYHNLHDEDVVKVQYVDAHGNAIFEKNIPNIRNFSQFSIYHNQ